MDNLLDGWENLASVEYLLDKYSNHIGVTNHLSLSGGEDFFFDLTCEKDYLRAYKECPPLKALIGKRAKAFNTGVIDVYNSGSDKKGSGVEANSIRTVLNRPNILQTQKQYFAQQNHYIDIFGYCPVLRMRPVGMVDELSALWNLPPWLFDLDYTKKWLLQAKISGIYKDYFLIWNGERIKLNFEDIFFIFDDGIGTDFDSNLTIPDSRLVGLEYPVSNICAAYKTRNTLITKRGAIGILSNGAKDTAGVIPLIPGEKESLQSSFRNYGLVGQPFQIIISEANLQWQQMGFATRELMLFEEIDDDISRLCDAYGWPLELMAFALKGNFNYSDKKEAIKSAYRDAIIPESESRMEQFTNGVISEGANLYVWTDYTKVEVLQQDKMIIAQTRSTMSTTADKEYKAGLITKNRWLELIGEPKVADPTFDEYYEAPTTPEVGNVNPMSSMKGMVKAKAKFSKGDSVKSLVNHMEGMKGMIGEIKIVRTSPAYYGIKFEDHKMGKEVHKWLAEDEIEDASEDSKMDM